MTDLKNIKGLIWDMDGTLYRYDEIFKTACNHAAAKTACQVRPNYTYDYALEQCIRSEKECGFSLYWFHQETKMTFDELHFVYHDSIDEKVIERNERMGAVLRVLSQQSVLLTNASRGWATRVMNHLDMADIFHQGNILALEDFDFQPKGRGTLGFEKAIEHLGFAPEEILMVEDLPRNLIKAKEAGLKTALVHHGVLPDDQSMADFLFDDAIQLAEKLAA